MANIPFETGRAIGTNISQSMRKVKDESAIERILSESQASGDPEVLQQSIGQILSQVSPERQPAAIAFLQNTMQKIEQKKSQGRQREAAKQYFGSEQAADLPAQVQAQLVKDRAKQQSLSQYGIGLPPQAGGMTPGGISPAQIAPQEGETAQRQPPKTFQDYLNGATLDQLTEMTGSPYKEVSEPSKATLNRRKEEATLSAEREKQARKEQIEFHKESAKYDEDLLHNTQTAKKQMDTIKDIQKSVKSGNVKPSSLANIFKGMFGTIGDKISEALINKDQATLLASIPQLLEGWKQVFGVRLTDADLALLQDKLPSIGKSPEANLAVLNVIKKYGDMTLLRSQIASQIKEANGGLRPLGYMDQVEKRFDELIQPINVISPVTNKMIEIPLYKLSDALKAGAKLSQSEGASQ